jgi:hypothetical protein
MTVLVPIASSTSHYQPLDSSTAKICFRVEAAAMNGSNHDQVPCGVVSSMRQRLLEQIHSNGTWNRHSLIKSSHENLSSNKATLSKAWRLSRSHENLVHQDKGDCWRSRARCSITVLPLDEVPKPGDPLPCSSEQSCQGRFFSFFSSKER